MLLGYSVQKAESQSVSAKGGTGRVLKSEKTLDGIGHVGTRRKITKEPDPLVSGNSRIRRGQKTLPYGFYRVEPPRYNEGEDPRRRNGWVLAS